MGNDNEASSAPTDHEFLEMESANTRRDAIRMESERIVSYIAAHPDAALELESYGASAEDFDNIGL